MKSDNAVHRIFSRKGILLSGELISGKRHKHGLTSWRSRNLAIFFLDKTTSHLHLLLVVVLVVLRFTLEHRNVDLTCSPLRSPLPLSAGRN
mmetsp:Transcript_60395/g.132187  ORF Transcript_60395/g.132187 Transcript_60395/m.132187 type:complete len:91 (+) Transcript_60395:1588-1860(+)